MGPDEEAAFGEREERVDQFRDIGPHLGTETVATGAPAEVRVEREAVGCKRLV